MKNKFFRIFLLCFQLKQFEETENSSIPSNNINEQIQSFVSILFTVIIFAALALLIVVLYKIFELYKINIELFSFFYKYML